MRRALRSATVRVLSRSIRWHWGLRELTLEVVEVLQFLGRSGVGQVDQTVVGGLLRVLVHKATRVHACHLGAVQSADFRESTWGDGVAAILRQEERKAIVLVLLHTLVPARDGERRLVTTPRVVVERKEVGADAVRTTVHVGGGLDTVGLNIGSRVTDGDWSLSVLGDVCLHVTRHSLDVRRGVGVVGGVDDFVAGEEGKGVGVVLERVDGREDALKVDVVVRTSRVITVDGVTLGVDIEDDIDTSVGESAHTRIVVGSVVDGVDTHGVDAELGELLEITSTAVGVSNGILWVGSTAGLVVDTADEETGAVGVNESCQELMSTISTSNDRSSILPLPLMVTAGVMPF